MASMMRQKTLDYCVEENNVLREVFKDKYQCKHVQLSDAQKKRLSQKAITMDHYILEDVVKIYQPETVLGWHRDLVGKKYDSSENSGKRGRKPISPEFVDSILRFADRNPEWGYRRIASVMTYLEMKVSPSTIKRVLLMVSCWVKNI